MTDLIGSGVSFPLQADQRGVLALAHGVNDIEQAISLILGTAPGERPMRPEFGCRVHDFVFAPADTETANRIAAAVRTALERWEPRISLEAVLVAPDPMDATLLYIDIRYSLGTTNDPRNLVFPFYVIPAEEPAGTARATGAA